MGVTLDDDARQYLAAFEDVTGVDGRDCLVTGGDGDDDRHARSNVAVSRSQSRSNSNSNSNSGSGERDRRNGAASAASEKRLLIVVANGRMGEAIGPDGRTVKRFEDRVGMPVRLVEDADDPATFVANALAPAAVYNVTISENEDTVAYVEVADEDRGVAIGSNGRTIEAARRLAERHFDVDDVQLI
ncbi:NusA-like transcription termination signal-binding factor [Halobiforma nitratireducens]|uniref:Probable transcription termination protein NusA n=1 Tax=Halobiforma nitratireducens JCM 10879 TaxID=1227454 RepID=M0MAK2_9EURY|nr:NusA-like transcription termination signal-binding factor [Halobiforma nitratireducens]EMA41649.1 transcription elongation factor NusA-like protein [Halobiforma nitratireducens JCM 10879]